MADEALAESEVTDEETDFEAEFAAFAADVDSEETTDELEEPGEEPGEPAETEAETDEAAEAAEVEPDPYEGMSEAAREKFDALQQENQKLSHQVSSNAGRVSAFQLKVNDLTREIDEIRSGATSGPDQPSQLQIKEAMTGSTEDWDQFREDYPLVAKAIDHRMESLGVNLQDVVDRTLTAAHDAVARVETVAGESADKERVDAVAQVYPKWTEAVATPDFKSWLDDQPPGVQSLAGSDDTADATVLLGMYDNHLVAGGKPSLKAEQAAQDPAEPGVDNQDNPEPTALERRRAQQVEDGTTIPSKPAGIDPTGESSDEFTRAFNYYAAQDEKAQRTA